MSEQADNHYRLGRRVRVFADWDWLKMHTPMAEGQVIGYIDGPSILVRDADGQVNTWPVSLPIEDVE